MTNNEKFEILKELIYKLKSSDNILVIKKNTVLSDLKIDSLDIVELQVMYEEQTGKTIPDPKNPIITVKDLLEIL